MRNSERSPLCKQRERSLQIVAKERAATCVIWSAVRQALISACGRLCAYPFRRAAYRAASCWPTLACIRAEDRVCWRELRAVNCDLWSGCGVVDGLPLVGHEYAGSCGLTLACIRAKGCEWWAGLRDVGRTARCGLGCCSDTHMQVAADTCIRTYKAVRCWQGCERWAGLRDVGRTAAGRT